jgi:type VI secretion system protein ImpJ
VSVVEIDPAALAAEQLKLLRFSGVLPDGLLVAVEDGDAECPPATPLAGRFPPTRHALEVYLAAPREREGTPSVVAPGSASGAQAAAARARARYAAATRPVPDLLGQGEDLPMAFAQRNLVWILGDDPRDDYDAIKVAEIVRDGAGRLVLNEAYVPPILRADASAFVMGGVRRLLALMVAKRRSLADERKQRDPAAVEYGANDVTRFLQLDALNRAIPVLTELARSGEQSPFDLYLFLVQIAGQLSSFSPTEDPSTFPAFNYGELRTTYEELFARMTAMLQTTAKGAFMAVPLELNQGVLVGKLTEEHLARCGQYVLGVKSELPEEQVAQRLPSFCKMASFAQLPYILRAATPGVPLKYTSRPPSEVPIRPGVVYFTLDLQSDHWKPVLQEKSLGIYLPVPFEPTKTKVELFGLPRAG